MLNSLLSHSTSLSTNELENKLEIKKNDKNFIKFTLYIETIMKELITSTYAKFNSF